MRDNARVKPRRAIAILLMLLLVLQPAFAAGKPRCAHHGEQAAAMAHHEGMQHHDHHGSKAPKACDCGCLGMMAGCAHAFASIAIGPDFGVVATRAPAEAPDVGLQAAHPSARFEPPLRPPTLA